MRAFVEVMPKNVICRCVPFSGSNKKHSKGILPSEMLIDPYHVSGHQLFPEFPELMVSCGLVSESLE